MSHDSTNSAKTSVTVSKAIWARVLPDGSVNAVGTGPDAIKAINLVVAGPGDRYCMMGFVGDQALGIPVEQMRGVGFLSKLGYTTLVQPVISQDGQIIALEKEIARLNDRLAPYENVSEDFIIGKMAGLLAMVGLRVVFKD